jgi:hypothetical protein
MLVRSLMPWDRRPRRRMRCASRPSVTRCAGRSFRSCIPVRSPVGHPGRPGRAGRTKTRSRDRDRSRGARKARPGWRPVRRRRAAGARGRRRPAVAAAAHRLAVMCECRSGRTMSFTAEAICVSPLRDAGNPPPRPRARASAARPPPRPFRASGRAQLRSARRKPPIRAVR